jgi:hypothetical protein
MKKAIISLLLLSFSLLAYAENPWQAGSGSFVYTGYAPLAHKPITVYYYIPVSKDIKNLGVLFAMHGADRAGAPCVETWRYFAEKDGFIVIAPEYSKKNYTSNEYQLGGVFKTSKREELNPQEKWTYNTIEALFDYLKECTGNTAEQYDIWGHSAGGQFVGRFMLALPNARVRMGVASNPSSWTYPLIDGLKDKAGNVYGWPYSVKDTPFATEEWVRTFLARPLVVHSGNADISTTDRSLDKSAGANAQGICRFDRGKDFYKTSRAVAKKMKTPFKWKFVEVDEVGHAGRSIVYGKSTRIDGKRVFNIDYITTTGAYFVLYGKNKK